MTLLFEGRPRSLILGAKIVMKIMIMDNCFTPGTLNTHTNTHCVRGRPTIKDAERQFRNGSFRELKKNAKIISSLSFVQLSVASVLIAALCNGPDRTTFHKCVNKDFGKQSYPIPCFTNASSSSKEPE